MKIINALKEIIKDVRYFLDKKKLNIDDIPPMQYPKGYTGRKGPDPDNKPDWMINDRNRVLKLKYKGLR